MEPPAFPAGAGGLQTVRAAPGSDADLVLPPPNGTPPFHYVWSRAGASLDDRFRASEDAGGVRLTVSAARTGDSGIYTLQASNAAGKDTRRLRLEVSAEETPSGDDPPTFLRRLQDLTVKVGTRTRFLVEIVSSTECKVTWYRNERRLMEAERVSLVRDGNFWCADVAAVSVDDAGRWTCTAENIGGRASCSAHLNVLVPKAYKRPEFVEELRAVLTEQGTVSLECKVVGVPTPILRWFKDSREIKAGDVFALTANAEDPTSLGTYTCEAVNCMGRAYSSSKVHVIGRGSRDGSLRPGQSGGVSPEPPLIFTKELEAQSVKICDPLTLSCHIVVPPWPRSVVWYNKEGKIEPNERYHVTEDGVGGYLVEVTSSEWRDEGEWKCVATSAGGRLGITTCYVTMEVPKNFRKPRFMENLQAILTEEGLVSFECKVVGFPTPVLSWFKDGQELKPGDVYQLTGTNSLGSYCCIARNCMGQASSSAELTVEDIQNQLNEEEKLQLFSKNQAPKFLQGLKSMEARIDEPFRFTVKVAIPPEPSVLWYRDDQPVDDSPRCHLDKEEKGGFFLDIRNLEFLDQAEWKCVAINDFGHSVTSCFLKLIIPRHYKKPRFLENLQAILSDEGAVNLECKVIGVPQPVLKWYKDGEELKPGDIHRIISGQDGTCCLGTYTCEAQNCMGIAASSASLLGFDDSTKTKSKKKIEEQTLQRNLSLSTIHEERTSQMYDTPVGDITLDDKGEISFSFDGKEVSVSLYETPDLTEEEALQIVEMYADQLSENITEHNVVELPPLRFVKETSNSGNLLMEAIIIDVSPEYFASPEEDLRTEADIEDISIADENVPSQLSFDQDLEEKYLPVISDDKYEISQQLNRKKSDSQKSADEYFSLSRDHSLSEEKRDDNTEVISESDLLSFASAHSSGKPKTKTNKISPKVAIEPLEDKNVPRIKSERKSSCSSRRSSTESEKSLTKRREDMIEKQINPIEQTIPKNKLKETVVSISTSLDILVKDVQKLENEIILKSEYMSSIITASKSVEIINSVLSPLSEINTIIDELNVCLMENSEVNTCLYNVAQSLKSLQQALTIIEKCIDVESENKTLVKKTCVLLIEKCGNQFQELMRLMKLIKTNGRGIVDNKVLFDIESISNEIITIVNFTAGTIKTNNLLIEADKLQVEELSIDVKHLRDTQKGIQELKRPLISLLNIVKNAELETSKEIPYINDSSVILADMSASIQDLQFALEQIEVLSIKEDSIPLNKYNTEIINSVLNPVLELRNSFEQLSAESKYIQDKTTLNQKLASVKSNINVIFSHLSSIEENVGAFDILQNDNKLETLQKMANILILLESNLTILDHVPSVKEDLSLLHKKLTKILENVIESNEAKKYYDFVEVCDVVKGINNFIQNDDSHGNLNLASISNALNIIKDCLVRNIFDPDLNNSVITIISKLQISIQEKLNQEEHETFNYEYEYLQLTSEHVNDGSKAKSVMEHIERTLVSIATVTSYQSVGDSNTAVLQPLENVVPVLEELKNVIASMNFSGMECVEHVSEITEVTSQSVEILAKPLFEINRHVSVLSEVLLEDPESIKGNHPVSIFAQALNELCETLEILQHDIISQLGEYPHRSFSLNFADTVQSLHSAILMIQNNVELEVPDELSTLEDISGLKTTADTVQSDHLAIPIIEHKKIQEILDPTTEITPKSSLVHILHLLNKKIILLQNPQIEEILEKISKSKLPHSLSLPTELANLQSVIQEILHPMMSQSSENVLAVTTIIEIGSLSESMIALQQMLSQIITENIPSLEGIVDISSDLIHSVHLSIAELRDHLDKCIKVIFPALNVADITINVSNNIATLKETCELLCDLIADSSTSTKAFNEKLKTLNFTTKQLLDAFDGSKKIDVKKIKHLIEELYKESLYVEEDILSLAPLSIKEMEEEAHLLEALHKIESSITILEQYEYISLSNTFNLHNCTPQRLKEIDPQILCQLDDILITTSNVMHNLENHYEVQEDIKSFIAMCQKKFVVLRSSINKNITYKGIIRLYQEFIFMHNLINLFKENILVLSMPRDVEQVVTEFLKNINNVLDRVRICVIKILEKKMELIFTTPKKSLTNNCEKLAEDVITVGSSDLTNLLQAFLNAKEIILPSLYDLDVVIIKDLNLKVSNYEISKTEENIINEWENFEIIFEKYILMNLSNANQKQQMDKANQCIQRYHNVKDSIGRAKQLILLQCMAECSEILKDIVLGSKELQNVNLQKQQLLEISLSQIYTELFVLCEKLKGNNKKILAKNTDASLDSYIFNLNEKLCKFIVELEQTHRLIITSEVKLIILKVCNEIHSVKKHLKSLEGQIIPMTINNFVNTVDKIEKLITVIFSQEAENVQIQEIGKLMDHINEFVSQDTIEVINKIAISSNFIDADKTVKLATELKENISAIMLPPEIRLSEETLKENLSKSDISLAFELQQALSIVTTEIYEKAEELASQFDGINVQQVQSNLTSLSSDLNALITSAQVVDKKDDVKEAVVESENDIVLETVTEGEAHKKERDESNIGQMMEHINEFVSQDTIEVINKIAISSNVIDADKTVKLATELKENISAIMLPPEIHLSEETLKENLSKSDISLAFELQQALSIVTTEIYEKAEELASQFDGINVQQVQSNLTSLSSDLNALITSAQVVDKKDDVKEAVVESENAIVLETVSEGEVHKEEKEESNIGKLMEHINEFVSQDTIEVINKIAILSNVIDADKTVKLATELKENISAIMIPPEIHLSEETLKENLSKSDISLAFELQQALSIVTTEIYEKAEELASQFDGINVQQVQSNLTSLSSDLNALITSAQVVDKKDDVKEAVVESENAIVLETVTEGEAHKKERDESNIGKMMEHINEFVSQDTIEVINKIAISSNVIDADKTVKLATELKENISAIMLPPEIHLSEETLKENLSKSDISLAFELQQALSIVTTEIYEKAEELASQFDGINVQQVQSNLTSLSSDLNALITSAQVVDKKDDVKEAVVESENAIVLETVTEGEAHKKERDESNIGKMMEHINEFVSQDTIEVINKIAISSNVIDADKTVKLATELKENISAIMLPPEIRLSEETLKENLSKSDISLAFELQQALSIVTTEIYEKAEELASQFDGINVQQVQSNLTSLPSHLNALITSAQVVDKKDDVKEAVVESENAIVLETVSEGEVHKEEKEESNIGKMMEHINEFVSQDTIEVINKIAISSNVIDADKTVKLATELKENISAIMLPPEIHLSEETLKENLSKSDISLAFELQQALSIVTTEIYEKAEELASQFDDINVQQVQSNLTSLSSDLNALITSAQVVDKKDDVKEAVVESENAIVLETVTEGEAHKKERDESNIGKMMEHINEFVSQDTIEVINKIAISSNVIDADKTVKLATELKENISAIMLPPEIRLSEETLKENLSKSDISLAFELQQALSIVTTEIYEKAEELASQFDGINVQQVQSNLTSLSSDLNALITSAQVVDKKDDVKEAVVESENAIVLETVSEGEVHKEEKEESNIGKLMEHINEFVSQDTIEVINKIAILSNVIDADKTVKLATELKENISAIMLPPEIHLSEETLKENLSKSDISLAFELQQALSIVTTEIYEKAEELASQFDGINVQQVQSNLTSLSSDLNALITSAQVVDKKDDVKEAVVESENAIVLETVTEGEAHKKERDETNIGQMMEHINEFVSQDTIEVINKIAISSNVIDADKTVKLATELKENISAIMLPPEIHLSEETLKENLSKSDISLAFELQQALSIVTTEIYEKAEELASQFDGINVQQVQSNLTSLSSDLNALITSAQVVDKKDDVKEAVVESENAIVLETVTEGEAHKKERDESNIGQMMEHINEFVSQDTIEVINKIAISSNVIDADKTVKLATELKENISAIMLPPEIRLSEETLKENLSKSDISLAFELQQALSIVTTEIYEKAEELASQFDGINVQQVQSNLTSLSSDLNALITSAQVVDKKDDVKEAVVESENAIVLETVTEGEVHKEEKEESNIGKMMEHINEFVSQDTIEVINKIAISSNVIDADKTVKLATELKENISAIMLPPEIRLSEETLKENLSKSDISLAFELQQALSIVTTEIYEKAEELASQFDGINVQQVQSNLTSLSSDLNALITSAQVVDKKDDVKEAVVESENAIVLETVTEGEVHKEEKEESNIGKLMEHINEFVSQDTIEVINKIAILSNVIDADKTVKLATELKENISAIMLPPEIRLSEETLKENLSKSDISLAFELQQALSIVTTEIYEKAEELASQFDGINVQQVQSNLTSLSSDLNALITSAQVVDKKDDVKEAVVESENAIVLETVTEGEAHKKERDESNIGKMMEHINEFVSQDTIEVINKIAISSNVIDADKTVKLATELKENISAIMLPPEIHLSEETLKENLSKSDISLAFELQQALSIVTTEIYEKAEELASQFDGINVQQVQSNLTSLSSDLNALITSAQVVDKKDDVKEAVVESENAINLETVTEGVTQKVEREELDIDDDETKNTLHNLKSLLKEVSDKINMLATSKTAEDIETLQNTLDEIQAVIIELKRDYIESVNDTLNESLQDLECSVRSVQLLINEESPPELVKEACETLQLLVSNMCEMHEFQVVPTTSHKEKLSNIIRLCSNDTEETIHLLESALSMKSDNESEFDRLYTYVNELKLVIKSLKVSFADNSENLIEKGIEIMQNLDQIEDQVFGLEKEVDIYKNLTPIQRDSIVTAIHSVYGSISNMRSAMSSVQKHYMYENYGKSSELILNALKSITFIANKTDKKWKTLSKSLRKVLNHFEDIKFYINFDKTARIPGDAAFTKIILLDLKAAIESLIFEHDKDFGEDITFNTKCLVECLEMNLLKMESKSNLQVKEKIPIFKSIGKKICALASSIKEYLEVSEKKENINTIEALQCQDSFNIATNKLFKESLLVKGPIDGEHIEDALKDVLGVSIEKMPFIEKDSHENFSVSKEEKDAIQYSSNIIKNVKVPSGDLNSTDVIDKKEKTENTGFTINTHAVDFTLEILPETIMTENIPEVSTLNLEASKPLEAPLLQIIDTGILYKAHVNEAVIGFVLDSDSKEGHAISQDSKEFKEIEKEKPVINQTPEVEPKFEETSTLIDHINETNKRLKKDIMIDESQCVTSKEFLPIEEISEPTDEQGISSHVDKKSERQEHDFVAEKIGEGISQKFGSADENDVDIENTIQKDKMIVGRENEKHLENYDKFENNIMKANKCDLVIDREILDDKNAVKKSDRLFDEENNEMNFTLAPKAIHELDSLKQINNVRSCIENEMNAGDNNEMTLNKAIANAEISEKEQDNESLILNIQKLTTEVKSGVKILQDVNETVEIKVDSNSQIPLLEGTKLDTNDDKKIPIKQEVKEVLQSTNLLGEVVQKSSSDEDVVSQIITLKQTITNDYQLKENFKNQNKEEKTVLDPKAEKSSNIIGYKNEDKTEMENIGTNKERNCTDEEATTNKHLSDKEKPKHKKKDVRSKKQVQSPQIVENKVEESKSSEVKEVNVFQQKDTLKTEEELIHKSIEDVKGKPNENQSSEVSKTIDNIILDKVSVQDRQSEEKIRKDKVENKNIDVETNLFMKNVSEYQREDIQISETLKSNNANIEGIQNITFFEKNDNVDNTNEFDLQLDSNIKRQVDEHNGVIFKELEDPTLEQINMRKLKKIEVTSYDKLYSNEAVSVDNSFKSADTTTKNNAVFVDRTRNYYENEFLRPPGYVERTFNNDHSNSELDITQSYPFYKAQTIVRNTQYDSPLNTCQIQSNEAVDRRDVSHKLNALNETRSFITEKRSKLLRDVKRKPVFSTYLTDRTAVEGSRVKLTCSVLTTLEPKIVWFKNGVPLDNKFKYRTKSIDGLLTMEVLNAEPSDSAEYSCTVETENGSVTTSAILKVYPSFEVSPIPPTFTRSIRDKYHHAENELVLECRIRGQPLPTITWLKDDRLINITDRYQAYYLADGVCRLTISNPSSEDSGKYTCKAENSMWSDQINHIVTFTGIESRFGLHSTSGESSRINRQSSEARRPHFTNVLTDYKVSSGGTIGLQVEIKGSPTRVEWLREGHAITDIYRNAQTFVDHGLYTLALSDVTEKESGIYTCRAWSKQGNVDMTAAITVVEPNEIDGKPAVIIGRPQRDVLISVGEDINISFRVQGEPKPKVTLMKGIRDITNSPRVCKMKSDDYMKFTLKRSVISDAGTYCILARNAYGCDRAFVTVVVRQRASSDHLISDWTYPTDSTIIVDERRYKSVPNRIPGELSVVDGGSNWISLAWPKVDPEGGAPVLAYKIESWLLGKEGGARWIELGITPLNSFEAYNLKQGEEYHFRVTPRNRYGWGESVQTSTSVGIGLAGDRPEFVEVLPGQLKVLFGETATLKCSFKGKPTPEIVWMKNGHEIDEENQRLKTCINNYNCSLTIHDVQINDEARYSCEATNVHGRASTYARVAVVTDKSIWEADTKLKRERSSDGGECPPQFTMRLRDRRVQATYPVRLTCQVIGRPPPLVTWYKNGKEVIDDDRRTKSQDEHFHTLEIAPTTLEDGGVYEATARNGSGAISCRCNLVVDKGIRAYIAPEFCCGLEPLYQLSIGQELRISAVVEAYPSVGVTWYRDGVRLRPSRRAVMTLDRDGQIELAVGSVTQRDAGVYTCTASNEVGKASTSGKVEVFGESDGERKQAIPIVICSDVPYSREPTFIRKPRSSEAYEGDTIIIECEVTGDPKPDVFWLRDFLKPDYYRDGSHFKRVGDGPEYRFEIPHAKLDYTGAYSVVARNVYGEAKAVISLQILAKDPRSTEEAHNIRYGRVEVIPRFEKELTDLLSHDGDAVEFECRVTGEPEPDIKWYHYTKIIRECSEFETSYELGTARLKIKQVTADDEGTYTCEAYNYLGKAISKACLVVYPAGEPNTLSQRLRRPPVLLSAASTPRSTPARSISRTRTPGPDLRSLCSPAREIAPKFYTYPYNKVAEEGDTVVFQCAAKGLPAPWATWDKDGVVITPSSRITIKEKDEIFRILEIDEVNSEDVGLYRVTLENDYGRAEATARLDVISQKGKFYASGRSYSASPRKSLPYKRSIYSLPRQD
ncbi:uncharacterized protein LOC106716992 [Papilio machaon]|uniref:uncharacterized protein LOC106716992 n=1 Tax=Papilio machaon TaxID=76193 RepID=UPI001E6659A6|nr:uncharacterized protein LOC106716992 [Papilio machaon]